MRGGGAVFGKASSQCNSKTKHPLRGGLICPKL
jgi:hypothetical protein